MTASEARATMPSSKKIEKLKKVIDDEVSSTLALIYEEVCKIAGRDENNAYLGYPIRFESLKLIVEKLKEDGYHVDYGTEPVDMSSGRLSCFPIYLNW